MKVLLIFLIIPMLSVGQTVHTKDENIVYEGKEKIAGLSSSQIFDRIQKTLPELVRHYELDDQSSNTIKAKGELKLKTPYHLIRTVSYSIELKATNAGYEYLINNVSFTDQERGEKPVTKSSKEILKNMGETGKIVGDTEKILNETDMRFQQLTDFLENRIKKD